MINYSERFNLSGKSAIVVGGLGLIGREISIALSQLGAKVILLDIDSKKGKAFEEECLSNNYYLKFIQFDITDLKNIDTNIEQVFNDNGPIHIWINASYPRTDDWGTKLDNIKISSWQKNMDLHLNSFCLSTRAIAELMKKKCIAGSIVNFGSIYGVGGPDFTVYEGTDMINDGEYAAIKGGIINFSRYAASYYGKSNIRVNCLCPGGVLNSQNPVFLANYGKKVPLGRMANPDEIASAALFLASDASSYMTGTTFMVDGGWNCI